MIPNASFTKVGGKNELFVDGFDPVAQYQMVPVGGKRPLVLKTDQNAEWLLAQDDGGAVVNLSFDALPPQQIIVEGLRRYVIPPASTIPLHLEGLQPGRANVFVTTRDFRFTHTLDVSVKRQQLRTFAIWLFGDALRFTKRTGDEAVAVMFNVSQLYRVQTNTLLIQIGDPAPIIYPAALDDPIVMTNDLGKDIADFTRLHAQPPNIADIWVYCTWNLKGAFGLRIGSNAFVADSTSPSIALHIFAHELGHVLGGLPNIPQDSVVSNNNLMAVDDVTGLAIQMNGGQIDAVNRTGPPPEPPH
jgi:hypothetical protein